MSGVTIYTDGTAGKNPGRCGFGAVLLFDDGRQEEVYGGFNRSTSHRAEMWGAILALEHLTVPHRVVLYSDCLYLVQAIDRGWARAWRDRDWVRPNGGVAKNSDLWTRLLSQDDRHACEFRWVRGHRKAHFNERADQIAAEASRLTWLGDDA